MSSNDETEHGYVYKVLVNDEEQYSLSREDWPDAPGWRETGKNGTREECLEYVNQVWTDMRPLSLRRRMEAQAAEAAGLPKAAS
jgi:MbtH protein